MTALTPAMATDTPVSPHPVARRAVGWEGPLLLADLRQTMNLAQVALMAARRPPAATVQLNAARGDYLAAMLAYERALATFGLPVPPRLRDELRLLRRLTSGA